MIDSGEPVNILGENNRSYNNLLPPGLTNFDRLTRLPIYTDEIRQFVAHEFSRCIRGGEKFAHVRTDLDNLKKTNDLYGRDTGSKFIVAAAATTIQTIEGLDLSSDAKVVVVRPSHAADEVYLWFFGLIEEDMAKFTTLKERIEEPKEIPGLPEKVSISAGLITSEDQEIKERIDSTREWLLEKETRKAFDLVKQIESKTDNIVNNSKLIKELKKITESFPRLNGVHTFIKIASKQFGGGRLTEEGLTQLFKIVAMEALHSQGVINDMSISSAIELFDRLFPKNNL